jgi:hypothetical protein
VRESLEHKFQNAEQQREIMVRGIQLQLMEDIIDKMEREGV